MTIFERINDEANNMALNRGIIAKYLYLGLEEYDELMAWIIDNVDMLDAISIPTRPLEFNGLTIFKVNTDHHLNCSS